MATHLHLAAEGPELSRPSERDDPIRVVLAESHLMLRRSLEQLLDAERDFDVVTETAELATIAQQGLEADVLVLDPGRADGSSIELIGLMYERAPAAQIVVLSDEESPVFAQRALAAGAGAIVMKDAIDNELTQAVRAAARGQEYVSPSVAARLDELHRVLTDNRLTPREAEVLRLIALGHTSVEIARKLSLSPRTVETHRAHIHSKLGLASRSDLVRYALRRGLLGS